MDDETAARVRPLMNGASTCGNADEEEEEEERRARREEKCRNSNKQVLQAR